MRIGTPWCLAQATRLGDAQMQRLVDELAELAISLDGHEDLAGLERDLEVLEVVALENFDMAQGGFHQRVGIRLAVFFLQVAFQRTGIDADANGDAVVPRAGNPRPLPQQRGRTCS
jgi:hypothetical protein